MSRVALLLITLVLLAAAPARAVFHIAKIDEIMAGAGANPDVQFVEIRMLVGGQNFVSHTRLTAFNCDGSGVVVLIADMPANVPTGGADRRWIMGTDAFATASGITPDFTFAPGIFASPTPCGMVCWGAPGAIPENPPTWAASNPNNYTDCVAYGGYTGARPSTAGGTPTSLGPGDGMQSLTRVGNTNNDAADFALACPTPTNNAAEVGSIGTCIPSSTTTTTTPGGTTTTTFPPGEGQRISGQRLLVKKAVLSAVSKDAAITLGEGNGSEDDPTLNGGSLRIRSVPAGADQTVPLSATSWRYLGKRGADKGYRLKPTGAVKSLLLKKGRLKVVVKSSFTTLLATNPNPVDVVLTTGTDRYCMSFGGTPKFSANKKYLATGAAAPSTCPP